jgi:hypothetical protein
MNHDFTVVAQLIHEYNVKVGWWDAWQDKGRRYETAMMLVISEIAEAMEGDRKDLLDDHLPNHKMFKVEIADAMIRLLDLAEALNIPSIVTTDRYHLFKRQLSNRTTPEQLYYTCVALGQSDGSKAILDGIAACLVIAELHEFDLWPILFEKFNYNKSRADHKREVRNAKGGKKF